ncbi:hypothetical protein V6N13_026409 [Hibiscus sabdariffa]
MQDVFRKASKKYSSMLVLQDKAISVKERKRRDQAISRTEKLHSGSRGWVSNQLGHCEKADSHPVCKKSFGFRQTNSLDHGVLFCLEKIALVMELVFCMRDVKWKSGGIRSMEVSSFVPYFVYIGF